MVTIETVIADAVDATSTQNADSLAAAAVGEAQVVLDEALAAREITKLAAGLALGQLLADATEYASQTP